MLQTRRWALALIYYYRSILCYCWGSTVKSFTPPHLWKFLERRLERMDRSPIENNSRPTLRGTSTCFRGPPGGSKVPPTYPPPTSFTLHRHLFALAWADARVTGDAEEKAVTFRRGESFWLYSPPQSPSRGTRGNGFGAGFVSRFGAGVGQGFVWFAYLPTILVCWLSDAFGTRSSYLWQTKGHTLFHCWTYVSKAPLRYALVVCLHFIPPNHEQMKKFYRQIRKYWRSYDIDTEI